MSDTRTYFAQVTNNIVTDVHVVTQEFIDENPERYLGIWIETFIGLPNKNYAGIGMIYDAATENFFWPPEPIVPVE